MDFRDIVVSGYMNTADLKKLNKAVNVILKKEQAAKKNEKKKKGVGLKKEKKEVQKK